jgi:hypothetical protein
MKKLFALLLLASVAVAGCSFDQIVQDQWGLLAIKNAARGLGYAVANSKTTLDDTAVEQAYSLLKTGQTDPVKINEMLAKWNGQPGGKLLVFAALDLLEAMGATISAGTIIDLSGIPPELWATVERSYLQGYELGKADKKAGVVRAVP